MTKVELYLILITFVIIGVGFFLNYLRRCKIIYIIELLTVDESEEEKDWYIYNMYSNEKRAKDVLNSFLIKIEDSKLAQKSMSFDTLFNQDLGDAGKKWTVDEIKEYANWYSKQSFAKRHLGVRIRRYELS